MSAVTNPSKVKAAAAMCLCLAVIGCGGSSCDSDEVVPIIEAIEPCVVAPGQPLSIYGIRLADSSAPDVSFSGGGTATLVSSSADKVVANVPTTTTSGSLELKTRAGAAYFNYEVGTLVEIEELEPNDAADFSNATLVGVNRKIIGAISAAGDKDFFRLGCLAKKKIRMTISGPAVINEVTINGAAFPITEGKVEFNAIGDVVFSVAGTVGNYEINITGV